MYQVQEYLDDNHILVNDKDLPVDPEWEKQQKKTFTAWCNAHLRKIESQIEFIEEDFRDGTKLMQLLEVISSESLLKPERGKLRFHQIANVNKALEFIGSKGVKLVSIGAEEIVDGNVKMTLGMIWTIILRFAIQNIQYDDISAKDGLLLWCQRQTSNYKNVNVQNFHTSFKDGLAFCALIHKHRPDLIEYSVLNRENSLSNLNLAFRVAEESLDIPKMLDPEDLANSVKPDERSIMAYVSYYYHFFTNERHTNMASNRISRIVKMNLDNDELRKSYETISSELIKWITVKSNEFQKQNQHKNLVKIQELLDQLRYYRRHEKALKFEEKSKLDTTFNTLQTRLRLSNRSSFIPNSGCLLNDINHAWKNLELLEKNYERWLLTELQRLQRIEHLNHKFTLKYNRYMTWSSSKMDHLNETCVKSASVSELQAMKRKYEAFASDLLAHDSRVETISKIADQLISILSADDADELQIQMTKLSNDWQNLLECSNNKRKEIEETLLIREKIDILHLEYAKRAVPFNNWLEQATEDLQDNFIIQSNTEVKRLVDNHSEFHKSLETAESDFKEIQDLQIKVEDIARDNSLQMATDNPYTHVSSQQLSDVWDSVKKLDKVRTQLLSDAREKQIKNDELQKEFANLAEIVDSALSNCLEEVKNIAVQGSGTLEEQLDLLLKIESKIKKYSNDMDALETLNQSLQDSFIFENSYTSLTLDQLRIKRDHFNTTLKVTVNQVENQILTRDSKGLTRSQMDDYRKCFNHFDRSKNGRLDASEFKALLVSLEYNIRDDSKHKNTNNNNGNRFKSSSLVDIGEGDFARIIHSVDPNNTGSITFETFLDFMTKEVSDQDSVEQIVDSFRFLCGDKEYISEIDIRRELPGEIAEYCLKFMPKHEIPSKSNGYDTNSNLHTINGHGKSIDHRNGFNSCSSRSETPQSCEVDEDFIENIAIYAYDFENFAKKLFI